MLPNLSIAQHLDLIFATIIFVDFHARVFVTMKGTQTHVMFIDFDTIKGCSILCGYDILNFTKYTHLQLYFLSFCIFL